MNGTTADAVSLVARGLLQPGRRGNLALIRPPLPAGRPDAPANRLRRESFDLDPTTARLVVDSAPQPWTPLPGCY